MARLVPHDNAIALAIAPTVWLAYFVLTFMVSTLGCERGWFDQAGASELDAMRLALGVVALIGFGLIALTTWQSYDALRMARDPRQDWEPQERERRSFLAQTGLFLSGISLLGILWGALNMFAFSGCAE